MKALTERQEKLLALFKTAVESEQEAQETYRRMLSLNDDPAIRNVLERLIGDERQHEEALIEMYNRLRGTEEFKNPA